MPLTLRGHRAIAIVGGMTLTMLLTACAGSAADRSAAEASGTPLASIAPSIEATTAVTAESVSPLDTLGKTGSRLCIFNNTSRDFAVEWRQQGISDSNGTVPVGKRNCGSGKLGYQGEVDTMVNIRFPQPVADTSDVICAFGPGKPSAWYTFGLGAISDCSNDQFTLATRYLEPGETMTCTWKANPEGETSGLPRHEFKVDRLPDNPNYKDFTLTVRDSSVTGPASLKEGCEGP